MIYSFSDLLLCLHNKAIKEDYLISPPEKYLEYNFTRRLERIPINGEKNQPIHVFNQIFKNRIRNGFFIEAGAYDGEISSNTLFFELKQNWTGLLVEPNPDVFQMLNVKVKRAYTYLVIDLYFGNKHLLLCSKKLAKNFISAQESLAIWTLSLHKYYTRNSRF